MSNLRFETGIFTAVRTGTYDSTFDTGPYTHLDFTSSNGGHSQIESASRIELPPRFFGGIIYEDGQPVAIYNNQTHRIHPVVRYATPVSFSMKALDNAFIIAGLFFGGGAALSAIMVDDHLTATLPLIFLVLALLRLVSHYGPVRELRRERRFRRLWSYLQQQILSRATSSRIRQQAR